MYYSTKIQTFSPTKHTLGVHCLRIAYIYSLFYDVAHLEARFWPRLALHSSCRLQLLARVKLECNPISKVIWERCEAVKAVFFKVCDSVG